MTKGNVDGYLDEIQERMDGDVFKAMVEVMVRRVMEEEVALHVGAERHERTPSRRGHRNGHKARRLKTRVGELALQVPQVRGAEPYSPMFFAKWQRSERALLVACAEMYFMGVSTRKVARVLEKMGGFSLSASTVSCVASELDEQLTQFRERRLDDRTWPYLMVDATYVKVRKHGRVVDQAVLVVIGVNDAGQREIITWHLADAESEDTWAAVFGELKQRGVTGVQWLTSDGHAGIRAAVRTQFTGVAWQRCWTHFIRNAMAKVGHKHKKAFAKERIAVRWERNYPRAAKQIRDQFEETLAVHGLPREHRRRVYTTNIIERLMREIKRRTHVVGIFPNEASCDRLIGAQFLERHEAWQCERMRYLVMEHLDPAVAKTPPPKPRRKRAA